jgi:hypothetical protein
MKYKLAEILMIDFSCSVQHSPTNFMKLQSPVFFCEGNSSDLTLTNDQLDAQIFNTIITIAQGL